MTAKEYNKKQEKLFKLGKIIQESLLPPFSIWTKDIKRFNKLNKELKDFDMAQPRRT